MLEINCKRINRKRYGDITKCLLYQVTTIWVHILVIAAFHVATLLGFP